MFCRAVNELKLLDYWITPFIRLTTAVPGNKVLKQKVSIYDIENKPVLVQLLGDNPGLFTDSAKRLQEMGISGINLNFACPSKQVLASNGGGKLLTKPDLMLKIVNDVIWACPELSVSIKLRSGFALPNEMESFLPEFAKLGLDFIIVHSRTVKEMYEEIPDGPWRISQAVRLADPIPLIASGDVFSVQDAKNIYDASSCAGITIARGMLKDPLLIRRILANLKGETLASDRDPRNVFFKKICEIAKKDPKYYKRSGFLEVAKFMWGEDNAKFEMLTKLPDNQILSFF